MKIREIVKEAFEVDELVHQFTEIDVEITTSKLDQSKKLMRLTATMIFLKKRVIG